MTVASVRLIHALTLPSRAHDAARVASLFEGSGVPFSVVSEPEPTLAEAAAVVDLRPEAVADAAFRASVGGLNLRNVSNALKHARALAAISSDVCGPDAWHVVLEDDALPTSTDVVARLRATLDAAPPGVDVLFLGASVPSDCDCRASDRDASAPSFRALPIEGHHPCDCSAYAVRTRAAAPLAAAFAPVRFATPVQLAWAIAAAGRVASVARPAAFADGSKLGTHASAVLHTNRLTLNAGFLELERALQGEEGPSSSSPDRRALVERLVEDVTPKDSVDVVRLLAVAEARLGRHRVAEAIFAHGLALHERASCLLTGSAFLTAYATLYRHLQDDVPDA